MKFEYKLQDGWPPLAWIARVPQDQQIIHVWAGNGVHQASEWFCEAVWDDDFQAGNFDVTDIVAGSGARIRGDKVVFVSSGSTVDRLQYLRTDTEIWVSNSIVCLMTVTGARPDPVYPNFMQDFNSITAGILKYHRYVSSSLGNIELVYFNNIEISERELNVVPKPNAERRFSSFEAYHSFLREALIKVHANMIDVRRNTSLSFIGTLSTGYDSSMIAALAKTAGVLTEVICFRRPNDRDYGGDNADTLELDKHTLEVSAYHEYELPEVEFLAANAFGEEVHYKAAEDLLKNRVLLSGYHGDKVWEKELSHKGPYIKRGDISGLALTEFRLHAGFINCPIAFWGVRQLNEIHKISNSEEMQPWDVGGDYNRPICRRIAESAALGRNSFGVKKRYVSRWFLAKQDEFREDSAADLRKFLASHRSAFLRKGRLPPTSFPSVYDRVNSLLWFLGGLFNRLPGFYRLGINNWWMVRNILAIREPNAPHAALVVGENRYSFPWAVERVSGRYKSRSQ